MKNYVCTGLGVVSLLTSIGGLPEVKSENE